MVLSCYTFCQAGVNQNAKLEDTSSIVRAGEKWHRRSVARPGVGEAWGLAANLPTLQSTENQYIYIPDSMKITMNGTSKNKTTEPFLLPMKYRTFWRNEELRNFIVLYLPHPEYFFTSWPHLREGCSVWKPHREKWNQVGDLPSLHSPVLPFSYPFFLAQWGKKRYHSIWVL